MIGRLERTLVAAGVEFRCSANGSGLATNEWGLLDSITSNSNGARVRVSGLLRALEDEEVSEVVPDGIFASWDWISDLGAGELRDLDLPPPA